MQVGSKAYLQCALYLRSLRDRFHGSNSDLEARASPSLSYAAFVLAFLLTILEIEVHRNKLESLGLARNYSLAELHFLSLMGP
jgi:hypothetical protein